MSREQIAFVTSLRPEIRLRSLASLSDNGTGASVRSRSGLHRVGAAHDSEADADNGIVIPTTYMPTCVAWDNASARAGAALYVGSGSGGLHYVDITTGGVLGRIGAHAGGAGDRVWSVSVSGAGFCVSRMVAYTDHGGGLRLCGGDDSTPIATLYPAAAAAATHQAGGGPLRDVDIHATRPLIACGSADGNAYVFDVRMTSRGPLYVLPAVARSGMSGNVGVLAARWAGPNRNRIVTATDDGSLNSWYIEAADGGGTEPCAVPEVPEPEPVADPTRLQPQRVYRVRRRGGGTRSPYTALSCRPDGLCATGMFGGSAPGVVGVFYPAWDNPVATCAVDVRAVPLSMRRNFSSGMLTEMDNEEQQQQQQLDENPRTRGAGGAAPSGRSPDKLRRGVPSFASVSWRSMSSDTATDDFPTCVAATLEGSLAALRLERESNDEEEDGAGGAK